MLYKDEVDHNQIVSVLQHNILTPDMLEDEAVHLTKIYFHLTLFVDIEISESAIAAAYREIRANQDVDADMEMMIATTEERSDDDEDEPDLDIQSMMEQININNNEGEPGLDIQSMMEQMDISTNGGAGSVGAAETRNRGWIMHFPVQGCGVCDARWRMIHTDYVVTWSHERPWWEYVPDNVLDWLQEHVLEHIIVGDAAAAAASGDGIALR
ncbi:unnamed protein product [Periconia digitata]|uniref:Uncharacterized protein n=1 Tax=Periconia digitata TaxID=1303443 RepID=A0A9W4UPJ5_9PLEO|nr:unnamed protein product [Periconia digitata]